MTPPWLIDITIDCHMLYPYFFLKHFGKVSRGNVSGSYLRNQQNHLLKTKPKTIRIRIVAMDRGFMVT